MRFLLRSETLIASAFLLFLGWVGVTAVTSSSAIASLQTQQSANDRSHDMVDKMAQFIPRLDERLNGIEKSLIRNTEVTNKIGVVQSKQNAKLYCLYSYPVKQVGVDDINADKRTKCVGTMLNVGG